MTKRWSSTKSGDGQTKRQASKAARRDFRTLGEGQGICPLCGSPVPIGDTDQIERDMDTDAKSCGVCCRTFGEARRECEQEAAR